ncbi:hypothetical protein EP331_15055 [bacterium]|nr:MAG: hypothetical protein EP331_15055 [bacterium]
MEKVEILSKIFGLFSVDEGAIVHFDQGIPGLEKVTDYAMVSIEEYDPIIWMISTNGVYHFPLVKTSTIDFNDFDSESRQFFKPMLDKTLKTSPEYVSYVILKLDQSVKQVSLRAPIVIDPEKRLGKQLVFDKTGNE